MRAFALLSLVVPIFVVTSASAENFQKRTLKPNSVICYETSDWREMIEASTDGDQDAAMHLITSGKCRMLTSATTVNILEPDRGLGVLIQMPSGKIAKTSDKFFR